MNKYYLTVREIREYADNLREQGVSGDELKDRVTDYVYMNTHPNFEMDRELYLDDDYDHIYSPDINEQGYPVLKAFGWESHERMSDFDIEIPVTRGFTDTPDIKDTGFYPNDVECACEMERDKHTKIYPWQLKQFVSADDLGLEENEFDEMLEQACGM